MGFFDYFYSLTGLHDILGHLLAWYIRLISSTCRIDIEGQENYETAIISGRPIFYVLWHQQLMPVMTFGWKTFDINKFVFIVEGGNRGNILAIMALTLNAYKAIKVDMQGNPVSSGRKVLEIIHAMRNGKYTLLAPDGPYGPAYKLKPGALFIAHKTNAAIVPCGGWVKHSFQLKRWDHYLVPLPYSRISVVFRKPIYIETDSDEIGLESFLTKELNSARDQARSIQGCNGYPLN